MRYPKLSKSPSCITDPPTAQVFFERNGEPTPVKLEKVCRLCRKKRRGTAIVEFAIVAPLFFLLVLGMIEFGRMVMVQQILTNASREGARLAVLDGSTHASVNTSVKTYMSNAGISGVTVTTDPSEPSTAGYGEPVSVTVSIPFSQVSWIPGTSYIKDKFSLATKTLSATTVMRRETVQ